MEFMRANNIRLYNIINRREGWWAKDKDGYRYKRRKGETGWTRTEYRELDGKDYQNGHEIVEGSGGWIYKGNYCPFPWATFTKLVIAFGGGGYLAGRLIEWMLTR